MATLSGSGLIRGGRCHVIFGGISVHQALRVQHHANRDQVVRKHEPIGSVDGQGDLAPVG